VAKETRRQRRDARRAAEEDGAARGRARSAPRPSAEPVAEPAAPRQGGGGVFGFIRESWAELQKVEWPGRSQVVQGTVVVLIACAIVGVYLYAADQVLRRLVENVLL
jgi:preprotein translocase subunit SecE